MPLLLQRCMLPLACLALLSACAQIPKPVLIAQEKLCESWRHQTIAKGDKLEEKTASQIEGNNKARPEWGCQYGENKAAGG